LRGGATTDRASYSQQSRHTACRGWHALLLVVLVAWAWAGRARDVQPVYTLTEHGSAVYAVAFSADGRLLASNGRDGSVHIWEAATGRHRESFSPEIGSIWAVAFSPDGETIAVGAEFTGIRRMRGGVVGWISMSTGRLLRMKTVDTSRVGALAFNPGGDILASASRTAVRLWASDTGTQIHVINESLVSDLSFSPDGRTLAVAASRSVVFFDVSSGERTGTFTGHAGIVYAVSFSPDGTMLASGAGDGTVRLWCASSGELLRVLEGHTSAVYSVAFSPDGQFLASGARDNTVRLWEVSTGRRALALDEPRGTVSSVAYSPDGTLLATGAHDRTLRLWEMNAIDLTHRPPVATFTVTGSEEVGDELTLNPGLWMFDASDAHAPDGDITEYAWDWSSDGIFEVESPDPVVARRFEGAGVHLVTLRVTDEWGAVGHAMRTVVVEDMSPPQASFVFSPAAPTRLDTLRFTDQPTDPDGRVVSWRWEFGDGNTSTLRNPTHQYTHKGTFTVRLTVTDDDGLTASTTRQITVVNLPPVASFTVALHIEHLGLVLRRREVTFDASGSYDPDGEIVRYAWDFGDGNTAEGRIVTHTYPEAGTYTVRLTVTDDDGMTDTAEQEVQVVPGGGGGPAGGG